MTGEPTLKAIETHYNGYRFRSRLEARWAVFFDAAGILYRYEPDGVETSSGRRWLPDFEIDHGGVKWYVEVKIDPSKLDLECLVEVCAEDNDHVGVLVLGDVPALRDNDRPFHGAIVDTDFLPPHEKKGYRLLWAMITPDNVGLIYPNGSRPTSIARLISGDIVQAGPKTAPALRGAYHKARAARFEFGETPKAARS